MPKKVVKKHRTGGALGKKTTTKKGVAISKSKASAKTNVVVKIDQRKTTKGRSAPVAKAPATVVVQGSAPQPYYPMMYAPSVQPSVQPPVASPVITADIVRSIAGDVFHNETQTLSAFGARDGRVLGSKAGERIGGYSIAPDWETVSNMSEPDYPRSLSAVVPLTEFNPVYASKKYEEPGFSFGDVYPDITGGAFGDESVSTRAGGAMAAFPDASPTYGSVPAGRANPRLAPADLPITDAELSRYANSIGKMPPQALVILTKRVNERKGASEMTDLERSAVVQDIIKRSEKKQTKLK